ncbi:MAG: hypothetical protein Q8P89_02550 [bacterium]|nr:hypothetical protein [bacterium]
MLPILTQSYWRDEAFSVLLSSKSLADIFSLTIRDISPPLYYFLLHFWIGLFGDAEYVTLLFLFLLTFSSFLLLKRLLVDWKVSLFGSLTVLLNPFLINYAFETRTYMLFAFLIVTAALFYLKRKCLIFSIFLTLAILSHNFGIFFLIAFLAFWFYENRESVFKKLSQFGVMFGLPIAFFLGWSLFLWNQWTKVAEGFWIGPKTSSIFIDAFRSYFQGSPDYPSRAMLYNITVALVFLALSYLIAQATKKEKVFNNESLFLVFLFATPFLIVYLISAFWVPIYHERFLMPILPIFIVWIVYSLFKLSKINVSLSCFIFALAVGYILFAIQSSEEIMRKTTKPAINYGVEQALAIAGPDDVIIPESNLNFLETKYYVEKSGKNIPVYAYSPDGKIVFYIGSVLFEPNEIIREYPKNKRIWVVTPDGGYHLKDGSTLNK